MTRADLECGEIGEIWLRFGEIGRPEDACIPTGRKRDGKARDAWDAALARSEGEVPPPPPLPGLMLASPPAAEDALVGLKVPLPLRANGNGVCCGSRCGVPGPEPGLPDAPEAAAAEAAAEAVVDDPPPVRRKVASRCKG